MWFNQALSIFFFLMYFHQFIYLFVGLFKTAKVKKKDGEEFKKHKYGVVIAARNEELVLPYLIDSIRANNYPQELIDIIVVADNCTDRTADICRERGCVVVERHDLTKVGKGYALNYLFTKLHTEPEYANLNCEAYIVLDADNVLTKNYIEEMNKVFDCGYDMATSYRNSKNFSANWISSGYGIWFLREARYLNNPRMILKTSAAISGTGFLVSRKVVEEYGNWSFFCLTEDIEFSAEYVLSGRKIGYAHNAMLYDEQPTTFSQAWRQRERWAKGFYQVFGSKYARLLKSMFKNFACWDIITTIFPALLISLLMFTVNPICMIVAASLGETASVEAGGYGMLSMIITLYATLFVFGLLVEITEWKKIKCPWYKKIFYLFTFPLFMFTYFPIAVCALFKKVEWKPIYHKHAVSIDELSSDEPDGKSEKLEEPALVAQIENSEIGRAHV